MERNLWLVISEDAEKLRRISKNIQNHRKSALVRMAANLLEQVSWELMTGRLSFNTIDNLKIIEKLLASAGLPVEPVRRALRISKNMMYKRINSISNHTVEVLGLP